MSKQVKHIGREKILRLSKPEHPRLTWLFGQTTLRKDSIFVNGIPLKTAVHEQGLKDAFIAFERTRYAKFTPTWYQLSAEDIREGVVGFAHVSCQSPNFKDRPKTNSTILRCVHKSNPLCDQR